MSIAVRPIDRQIHGALLEHLRRADVTPREFEELCEPIVRDILENGEGFTGVVKGPDFVGTPFDFFGYRDGVPHVIEFKGSRRHWNVPGRVQLERLQRILEEVQDLCAAVFQLRAETADYRIRYGRSVTDLFPGEQAPIEPVVEWLRSRLR